MTSCRSINRREACQMLAARLAGLGGILPCLRGAGLPNPRPFQLHYVLASSLYGNLSLKDILPEGLRTEANHLDLWPKPHGTQREEVEEMGHDAFAALLEKHQVKLGMISRYDLGPFGLKKEMLFAKKFGARLIITGSRGPAAAKGPELRLAVQRFVEEMKPHVEAAAEANLIIGIENHGHALIHTPDSIRYLAEVARTDHLGVALAPYHLPQEPELIAGLIKDLGPKLVHFYAWQHGKGAMTKLPKEEEMLQMPGRGPLEFQPILRALKEIHYKHWTSIFMHPMPRGIPILPTARQVTEAINQARDYLEQILSQL